MDNQNDNLEQTASAAENEELRDLGTHMAGATDLHITRHTEEPVQIDPPVVPNPGPYDTRSGKFNKA